MSTMKTSRHRFCCMTTLVTSVAILIFLLALLRLTKSTPPEPHLNIESFSLHNASTATIRFQIYNPSTDLTIQYLEIVAKLKSYEATGGDFFAETRIQSFGLGSRRMATVDASFMVPDSCDNKWKERWLMSERMRFNVKVWALVAAFRPGYGSAVVGGRTVWCQGVNVVNGSSLPEEITICN